MTNPTTDPTDSATEVATNLEAEFTAWADELRVLVDNVRRTRDGLVPLLQQWQQQQAGRDLQEATDSLLAVAKVAVLEAYEAKWRA
ncbi:hypothetical protein [Enemella evansiae]|uniref:hypothetical protein n=1 Tax=Enemella evansiae TaxID=2016499 RepID=UPI0015C5E2D7|nr:hypothetical protein [Enemella evansiae]